MPISPRACRIPRRSTTLFASPRSSIPRSTVDRKLKVARKWLREGLESSFSEFATIVGGMDQAARGDGPSGGDWSDELNERRTELIDNDIQGTITAGERAELAELQRKAVAYRDRVAPLPIEGPSILILDLRLPFIISPGTSGLILGSVEFVCQL